MPSTENRPRHVCRHKDPRIHFALVDDGHGLIKIKKTHMSKAMKAQAIGRVKNGSKVKYQQEEDGQILDATFVEWVFQQCSKLQDDHSCTLVDPKQCSGCVVIPDYAEGDDLLDIQLKDETREEAASIRKSLQDISSADRDAIWMNEILRLVDGFTERYHPLNKWTRTAVTQTYGDRLDDGSVELDDMTGRLYSVANETNEEQTIGHLRGGMDGSVLRQDLISMTAIHGNVGELTAVTGEFLQTAENSKTSIKSEIRLRAEVMLNKGLLPFRTTSDAIESLTQQSPEYKEAKKSAVLAKRLNQRAYRAYESLGRLIDTLKHEIKSQEAERRFDG